jgi:hypothetical protein
LYVAWDGRERERERERERARVRVRQREGDMEREGGLIHFVSSLLTTEEEIMNGRSRKEMRKAKKEEERNACRI